MTFVVPAVRRLDCRILNDVGNLRMREAKQQIATSCRFTCSMNVWPSSLVIEPSTVGKKAISIFVIYPPEFRFRAPEGRPLSTAPT